MKKITCLILSIALLLTLCACGAKEHAAESAPMMTGQFGSEPNVTPAPQEPTAEPATEPATEPAAEPATEPATEPAAEPATEPATEPAAEPATEPATEPTTEPATEPAPEPTAEPDDMVAPGDPGDIGHGGAPETNHTHSYTVAGIKNPTCTNPGYTVYICYCGDTYFGDHTDPAGHDYEETVVAPTAESEGYTEYYCWRCGDSYRDN